MPVDPWLSKPQTQGAAAAVDPWLGGLGAGKSRPAPMPAPIDDPWNSNSIKNEPAADLVIDPWAPVTNIGV